MKLNEKMHTFVYTQGYTIREKDKNNFGEHRLLRVKKDGSTDFFKYYNKPAGTPWGRFLNKRDAEYFMIKNRLSEDDYEVVKATHPRYLKLVDENYGLYKVIRDDDYDLITSEKGSVKFMDDSGTQQDYPSIPKTVKKSTKGILYYLFKDTVNRYWSNHIKNLRYKNVEGENYDFSFDFPPIWPHIDPSSSSFHVYFRYKLRGKKDNLENEVVLNLLDSNAEIKGISMTAHIWPGNVVDCMTSLSFNFADLLKKIVSESKLPQGVELTKMSDKDLYEIKKYIEENEKSIFDTFILKPIDEEYNILIDMFKEIDSNIQKYYDVDIIESLDGLSLKELFEKAYRD